MSDPQRRRVRVRRSPRIGVFLLLGVAIGAVVAIIAVNAAPADATMSKAQAIGFLFLILGPLGALIAGVVALVLDRVAERRAKVVDAERIGAARPPEEQEPAPEADAVRQQTEDRSS